MKSISVLKTFFCAQKQYASGSMKLWVIRPVFVLYGFVLCEDMDRHMNKFEDMYAICQNRQFCNSTTNQVRT